MKRVVTWIAYVAIVGGSVAVAYVMTRKKPEAAPIVSATPGHDHAAMLAVDGVQTAVTLSAADAQRIGVTFAVASRGPLGREIRTVGQVTFDETRVHAVSSKVDGWVETLEVNTTGQRIEKGQPLLTVYSPMLLAAQEELLVAKRFAASMATADADTRRRAEDLLASARRRLAYWEMSEAEVAEVERTGTIRRTVTLSAPVGGFVLSKSVVNGQKIMAGDGLYTVADLSTLWVEGEVFEQDIANVSVGQLVHAEFQALAGAQRTGRIAYIYPTLNRETRTLRVRVVLPNPDLRLKSGMYATLRIATTERQSVLSVPRSAVLSTGDRSVVFVRETDGRLVAREVTLGASNDERAEIRSGLNEGDTVVASATFLLDAESKLGTGTTAGRSGVRDSVPPKQPPPSQR